MCTTKGLTPYGLAVSLYSAKLTPKQARSVMISVLEWQTVSDLNAIWHKIDITVVALGLELNDFYPWIKEVIQLP